MVDKQPPPNFLALYPAIMVLKKLFIIDNLSYNHLYPEKFSNLEFQSLLRRLG